MFCACVTGWCGSLNRHSCTWKRSANIRRLTIGSPMFAIRRAPGDHDTQACCLGPSLCHILIQHFHILYCGYTRLRSCLLSTRLTQMWPRTATVTVHEQRVTKKKIWSFGLVKIHYPAICMPYFSNWVPELVSGVPVSPLWLILYPCFETLFPLRLVIF